MSFYKTTEGGRNWTIQGKVPVQSDPVIDPKSVKWEVDGLIKPAFEVLKNSTFIYVMRIAEKEQIHIYKSFYMDMDKTLTSSETFTQNGVKPYLILFNNALIVLASGRPGVQFKFSFNGTGRGWSEPIDMLPFVIENGKADTWRTYGYSSLLRDK